MLFIWRWYREHLWMAISTASPLVMVIMAVGAGQWEIAIPWITAFLLVLLNCYSLYKWEFWHDAACQQIEVDELKLRALVDILHEVIAEKGRDEECGK